MTYTDSWQPPVPLGDEGGYSALFDLLKRPAWHAQAACRGMGPADFFPDQGRSSRSGNPAKVICADCPVRVECGEYAVDHYEQHGTWGGMSPRQRQAIRSRRGELPYPGSFKPAAECGTEGGYRRHRRLGEPVCARCKRAHAEANRRWKDRPATRSTIPAVSGLEDGSVPDVVAGVEMERQLGESSQGQAGRRLACPLCWTLVRDDGWGDGRRIHTAWHLSFFGGQGGADVE